MTTAAWKRRLAAFLRRPDRILAVALLVTVLVRLAAVAASDAGSVDTYEFGVMGKNMEVGRGFSYFAEKPDGTVRPDDFEHTGTPLPSAFMPPVYVGIVAGALDVTSSDPTGVRALQALNIALAVASALLVFAIGTQLAGRSAGALAALAYALYPPLIYQATQVSASNVYVPLELLVVLLLLRVGGTRASPVAVAATGLVVGVVSLLRSEAVALLPLVALWLWFAVRRPARIRAVSIFLAAGALLPAAWIVRNSIVLDRFTPTITTTGGFNLWIGNHDGATGSQKEYEDSLEASVAQLPATDSYEVERDEVYRDAALEYMAGNPVETAVRDVKKLAMLVTADFYDTRSRNPIYLASWAAVLAVGVYGLATYRGRRSYRVLLYGYLGFSAAIPTAFFTLARYKLPLELLMLVFASIAIAHLAAADSAVGGDDDARDGELTATRSQ